MNQAKNVEPCMSKTQCGMSWNITNRCNLCCKHCLRRSPSLCLPERELSPSDALKVLDLYCDFARQTNRTAGIGFLGGNPLMRTDMLDILRHIKTYRDAGIINRLTFLANPEQLTPKMIRALAACQTDSFSISLDGLKPMNDYMRGPGNFDAATAAIRNLSTAGIRTPVKFTMTKENRKQIKETIWLALDLGCCGFGIGQLNLQGGGYQNRNLALSAEEYREFLIDIIDVVQTLPERYYDFARGLFNRYKSMIELIYREERRESEFEFLMRRFPATNDLQDGFGPGAGLSAGLGASPGSGRKRGSREGIDPSRLSFYVWPDGEVSSGNRRNPRIGWVPRNTFMELYEMSPCFDDVKNNITREKRTAIQERVARICARCDNLDICSIAVQIDAEPLNGKKNNRGDGRRDEFSFGAPEPLYSRYCWVIERELR